MFLTHLASINLIMMLQSADLDRQTLSICISLIENGVNPEALAVGAPAWGSAGNGTDAVLDRV